MRWRKQPYKERTTYIQVEQGKTAVAVLKPVDVMGNKKFMTRIKVDDMPCEGGYHYQ